MFVGLARRRALYGDDSLLTADSLLTLGVLREEQGQFHEAVELFENMPFDLVLLRDVLVYFPDEVRARILDRLRTAVVPGGFLFLGSGEVLIHGAEGWRSVALDPRGWLRGAA